jgi:arylsulfatase
MSFWRWPGRFTARDISALTAHIDFFPTIAEIVGSPLSGALAQQVEGRSLLPLLNDPQARWPERTLVTHVGRWPRFSNPDDAKFSNCSVRTPRWHLVSTKPPVGGKPGWELYDVTADPGEKNDVAASQPDVVAKLAASYDAWWKSIQPGLVNEKAVGPRINPFKEMYWKQFGGGPTPEELYIMEPNHTTIPGAKGGKKKK